MPRLKHVFSLILAASTLVVSTYSEAATIRYDVTNAMTVQNGFSLSGYFEVSGTGNVTSSSSFNYTLTATKADSPTLTFDSGSGNFSVSNVIIATDSALYVPAGSVLYINENADTINWYNDYLGFDLYGGSSGEDTAWSSGSYPNTDVNGWRIGSVQEAPSSVPEIDPNSLGSVLALVLGSLGLLERRRLKAA